MKKYYFIIPTLYILVVVILLSNYFLDSQKKTFRWGNLSVQVSTFNQKTPASSHALDTLPSIQLQTSFVKVSLPQVYITFNSHTSISPSNPKATLSSIASLPSNDGFVLSFLDDTHISFQTNILSPEEIAIIIQTSKYNTIQFSLYTSIGNRTSLSDNLLYITNSNTKTKIIASSQAHFTKNKNSWWLVSRTPYASFQFSKVVPNTPPTISAIPILPDSIVRETRASIDAYIDKAYDGWMFKRYNSALGTWHQPEGFYGFSELILISAYSEAIKRQTITKDKFILDKAAVLNKLALTWKSSTFQSDGNVLFSTIFDSIANAQHYMLTEAAHNNLSILNDLFLYETIPLWNNREHKNSYLQFIQQTAPINMPPETSAMLLYQSTVLCWDEFKEYIHNNESTFEQNLINNIVIANNGYMLLDSNKNIDIYFSIIAGKYLSTHSSQNNLRLLGYRILKTVLTLANDVGVLPRTYIFNNSGYTSLGQITPEYIYSILSDNEFYPSIQKISEDNTLAFTSSSISMNQKDNNYTIMVHSPTSKITEYIYVLNLPPPQQIVAFNVNWTGVRFPQYLTQGIEYNTTYNFLTVKMFNKTDKEIIDIYF